MYEIVSYSSGNEYLTKDRIIIKVWKRSGINPACLGPGYKIEHFKSIRELTDSEKVELL